MNIDLTHPEILTIEQLQKFVGSDSVNDRYELIELFYKYVAPLPQRKFRSNRLGTILTDTQKKIQKEKQIVSSEFETKEIQDKPKFKSLVDGLNASVQGEKHESDRGIYTIKMQNSGHKNTAPIKLKRPSSSSTTTTNNDQEAAKRPKLDGSTS